jgi:hypothetical protein
MARLQWSVLPVQVLQCRILFSLEISMGGFPFSPIFFAETIFERQQDSSRNTCNT